MTDDTVTGNSTGSGGNLPNASMDLSGTGDTVDVAPGGAGSGPDVYQKP